MLAPYQIDERELRFPSVRLVALRRVNVRKANVHLAPTHEHTQRIAIAHPHQWPMKNTFVVRSRCARIPRGRALGMAVPFACCSIVVAALTVDGPGMRASHDWQ